MPTARRATGPHGSAFGRAAPRRLILLLLVVIGLAAASVWFVTLPAFVQ